MSRAARQAVSHHTAGWQAHLELGLARRGNRTVLAHRRQRGPLAVQRPFHPEGERCHLYLLHPPGGVVGGDGLEIDVDVANAASAVVTTPGATKFYRSSGEWASQRQRLAVSADGELEWFPQENIFFPGAVVALTTDIRLEAGARFMGWEINCLGRPASRERFDGGDLLSRLTISRDGTPLLRESLRVSSVEELDGHASLRGLPVLATFLATGVDAGLRDQARQASPIVERGHLGVTLLDDLLVVRYLGSSTEEARACFVSVWSLLRPELLGVAACPPRIWST